MNLTANVLFAQEGSIDYVALLINQLLDEDDPSEDTLNWYLKLIATEANLEAYIGNFTTPTLYQRSVIADLIENFQQLYPYHFYKQPKWAFLLNYGVCDDE